MLGVQSRLGPLLALAVVLLTVSTLMPGRAVAAPAAESGLELFEQKIRPALVKHCYECHSASAKEVKGGLRLDTREAVLAGDDSGPAIVPGKPDQSPLIEALRYADDSYQMPPTGKLPASVVADFETWVRQGAADPRTDSLPATAKPNATVDIEAGRKFWAFQPPRLPAVPQVKDVAWPRTDIDRFILAKLEARGLHPVADADRRSLLRRAMFDLTGLPPTLDESRAFRAARTPDAFTELVERLLATSAFGERWGRHWLDVARYADSNGLGMNFSYDTAWRYRDYVIDALNRDTPFDQFVREQIAGDLLPASNDQQRASQLSATVFLMLGPKEMAQYDKPKLHMDVINEQVDTVGRAFLGLTVGCARCHDHKFDPIPTSDYYALAGIFKSTTTLQGTWGDNNLYSGWLMRRLPGAAQPGHETLLAAYEVIRLATRKRFRAAQAATAKLTEEAEKLAALGPPAAKDLEALNAKIAESKAWRNLLMFADERLKELKPPPLPEVMAVADESKPLDEHIHVRGEVGLLGAAVPRGFLKVASYQPVAIKPTESGRRELADWLASADNPLTARVIVNRVWSHLLDEGLVRTVDNLGVRGERPSHPELLDYLAVKFIEHGWSVKWLVREITRSHVYQIGSGHDAVAAAADPENRLLWRWNRHRLDADAIRDAMLSVSGQLDHTQGGPTLQYSGMLFSPSYYHRIIYVAAPWKRRSVYMPVLRDGHAPEVDLLDVFDFPNPNMVTGKRGVTTVPTQGLYLMNSPWVMDQARALAEQTSAARSDSTGRIELIYERALTRPPRSEEITLAQTYLEAYAAEAVRENPALGAGEVGLRAWSSYCQTILSSNEFLFLD